ncbi:acyl-CoA dehydrogenase [Paraburkholderia sp. J63]|uniref:acyl-CoA dehydrogenase n=1 Tax=Paraburkholderia sp. J63 TaxID=2805434 RepID=UPI002ABDA2C7|nr:acyl-CoA dehydrogenase [Paraburkholderia sp. J63]
MTQYAAPVADIRFVMSELAGLSEVAGLPGHDELGEDLVEAILTEAGKFAETVLAPLNASGDREGVKWTPQGVATPAGFREAYAQYTAAGWNNVGVELALGGQGLPCLVSTAVAEIFMAANKAFSMCPGLTLGAIEALAAAGSDELKARYLPNLVSGRWAGTMNLTEPQAGSDVGAIRCRAVPTDDGRYRIYGQKIFISYGEHDLTENIVHLVLARTPDAPDGVKGISLFVVPKFLVEADGSLGARNDVQCASVEHKLGIHGSPTCVMAYGERDGAIGYLVGERHRGLQAMFVMMNAARLTVGMEGVALAERAYQQARGYAQERVQGRPSGASSAMVPIIQHPDVKRMLMTMRSQIEAMRAMALVIARAQDMSRCHESVARRASEQAFVDLMTPVFKGWATETGLDVTSLGVQIHGGMGYVEETGAAQHLRDARISTIYEGTTGIQAADLVTRKLARDEGRTFNAVVGQMRENAATLIGEDRSFAALHERFISSVAALETAGHSLLRAVAHAPDEALAVSVPFLMLFGQVAGGWQLVRGALAAHRRLKHDNAANSVFLRTRIELAQFYAHHVLPHAASFAETVAYGGRATLALDDDQF